MKIVYILKKGFKYYPPCLAQVLMLDDCGVEVEVYHGKDTEMINEIFDKRGIIHHIFQSDSQSKNRIESAIGLIKYTCEVKKIIKRIDKNVTIWFGNAESVITLGEKELGGRFILSILELYNHDTIYHKRLLKIANRALSVICCEKHRAEINKVEYRLSKVPYVMPNKPYFIDNVGRTNYIDESLQTKLETKFVILYQGIITKDRPLDKIADAMKEIDNNDIYFVVMGACDELEKERLQKHYSRIIFTGFIPNPEHLFVTKYAKVGIANYDSSCLNNVFCAPNKIYEYAQFSIPMLTSNNLSLLETVGEAGAAECVNFNDVNEIKRGLCKIIDEYDKYRKCAFEFYRSTENEVTIRKIISELED